MNYMNMLEVTHTNGDSILVNSAYITCITKYYGETTHAIICLVDGDKLVVQETYDEIIEYLERLYNGN